MTKVTDALSQRYVFTYDALARQLSQTRAGTTMSFEYDAVGNRMKRDIKMFRDKENKVSGPKIILGGSASTDHILSRHVV